MRSEARALVFAAAAAAALAGSCKTRGAVSIPSFGADSLILDAPRPAPAGLKWLSGVYGGGSARFGADPVVHATKDSLSLFTSTTQVTYAITKPGCIEGGTRLIFEGTWRQSLTTETGLVRLELLPRELAAAVCQGTAPDLVSAPAPRLLGATGAGDAAPSEPAELTLQRRTAPAGLAIAAHRGACRTIDECGLSENSLESIRAVESFGASMVELDVRLTRDGVPVLFHDETMAPRLVAGPYCHGPLADLPLAHLRANCTLEYGERIPTLDEALATALDDTELAGVWLDAKVPEAVAPTVALMSRYRALAAAKGRALTFLIGLGDPDLVAAYLALPVATREPCLVELETSDVVAAGCQAWGPRWTRGPMTADVARMQAQGVRVYFWTLDEAEFLDLFAEAARPNGIVTDRAGLVLHRFHTRYAPTGAWP